MAQVQVRYGGSVLLPISTFAQKLVFERSADGTERRRFWQLTLSGTLLPWKGSPFSNGTFFTSTGYPADESGTPDGMWESLQKKKQAITTLFETDGLKLETIPVSGTARSCRPRWNEVNFVPSQEYNVTQFSVSGEADWIDGLDSSSPPTQSSSPPEEAWSLERVDEVGRHYKLTHTVSSQQKGRYDATTGTLTPGWQLAKDFILGSGLAGAGAASRLGYQTAQLSGSVISNITGFGAWNYSRKQTSDEGQGRFSVDESWDLFDPADRPSGLSAGNCFEELEVSDHWGVEDGLDTVTVTATVLGLEERQNTAAGGGDAYDITATRWTNASLRLAEMTSSWALGLAEDYTGVTLNPVPTSTTVSHNRPNGRGQVTVTFNNRPAQSSPSYLSEQLSFEFDNAVTIRPEIPVPFLSAGPVVQTAATVTQQSLTVSHEIRIRARYGETVTAPTTNPLALAVGAIGYTPSLIWMASDRPRWSPRTGSFSRTTQFKYQS